MYRRRRASREKILFSFDSFLDVVANVNGIIIRLILVAFVGARAYHSSMTFVGEPLPEEAFVANVPAAPKVDDDPLAAVLEKQRLDLVKLRNDLAKKAVLADVTTSDANAIESQLGALTQMKDVLAKQTMELAAAADKEIRDAQIVALSLEELA